MLFFSRLHERMTSHSRNRRTRRREPLSPFFAQAAEVETLENRCLLSGFSATTTYPIGTSANPQAVITVDVNGDGKLDLITANAGTYDSTTGTYVGAGVSVLLGVAGKKGTATGTFAPAQNYAVGPAAAVAVGDLNGDHKLDIVTASGGILLNNGNGTFRTGPSYTGGLGSFIATTDLHHDGKLDLITTGNNQISVLLGNGDGTFAAASTVTVSSGLGQVVVGDFNRDSNLDIVTISGLAVYLLPGNGDGGFGPAQTIASYADADADAILAATSADFNADGKLDLAVTYFISSTGGNTETPVAILLGNGDGTFHAAAGGNFGIGTTSLVLGSQEMAAADFNHDGKLDLIAMGVVPGDGLSILYGNGDGSFTTGQNFVAFYMPGSNPPPFAVGDFNGDGYADIAVAGTDSSSIEVSLWNPKNLKPGR